MSGRAFFLSGFVALGVLGAVSSAGAQVTGWSEYRHVWNIQTRNDAILITPANHLNHDAILTVPYPGQDANCTDRSAYPLLAVDDNFQIMAAIASAAFAGNDEFRIYYEGCYDSGPYAGLTKVLRIEVRQNRVQSGEIPYPINTNEVP